MTSIPDKQGTEYYRQYLSPQGKTFYDEINTQMKGGSYTGIISFPIFHPEQAGADCFAAYKAIRDDHPEYFFLGRQCEFVQKGNTGSLTYPVLYSTESIHRIQIQMRKQVYRLIRGTAYVPEIEKEKIIYERIAKKLSYTDHSDERDHNIVGPVLLSNGVCEGHNALLMMCLRRVEIPCIKVYGKTSEGGWHCWAIAWINGQPAHCDVTWDSPTEGIVGFNYMNLSDDQIGIDHFDFKSGHIPVCRSEELTYHRHFGNYVSSFNDLSRYMKAASGCKKKTLLLHFDYSPLSGNLISEVSKAIALNPYYSNTRIYSHPVSGNITIIKD